MRGPISYNSTSSVLTLPAQTRAMSSPGSRGLIMQVSRKRKRAPPVVDYAEPDEDDFYDDQDTGNHQGSKVSSKKAKSSTKVAKNSPKPRAEASFRFLDLPSELRNHIYELCLFSTEGVALTTRTRRHCFVVRQCYAIQTQMYPRILKKTWPAHTKPSIILTLANKQVREESVGYLYGQHFHFKDSKALLAFLGTIGHTNVARLQDITIREWGTMATDNHALTALAPATSMRTVKIEVYGRYCALDTAGYGRWLAKQVWRCSHFFVRTYGAAAGRKDAALDVLDFSAALKRRARRHNSQWKAMAEEFKEEMRRFIGV